MGTTEEALPGAILYLRVYFLGMVPNVIYNMGTGVLRAIGDFRRPLYFLMAASLCNIVLDLLLVVVFHMGVAGVAIATICSQLLSAVLVVISLMRSEMTPYQLFPKRLRIYAMPMRSILMIGVPTALQSVMYNASNIVIQASINSFGTDAVAAWTAYGKMDIIFWMTITAMAQSITTFAGQNYGAGEYERLKKGVRVSVAMTACFTVLLSAAFFLLAQPLQLLGYGLFTPASVYFVNESVPEADRVRGQTVMMVASNGMGGMLGGLLAGWTLDMGGANWMLAACIACGCAGAALCWAALRCPARRTV